MGADAHRAQECGRDAGSAVVAILIPGCASVKGNRSRTDKMYGLIGKMTTVPGQRDALISILLEDIGDGMPGCLSYIVAQDVADPNAIWITEVWDSEQSHRASLSLPAVTAAIARAKPLIASFDNGTVTEPVGGHGLEQSR
jgi:quinol monooxygenase YgiN